VTVKSIGPQLLVHAHIHDIAKIQHTLTHATWKSTTPLAYRRNDLISH